MLRRVKCLGLVIILLFCIDLNMAQTATGLAAVYKDQAGNYGYLSSDGKIIIPAQYKDAKAFSDGVALVKVKKSTGEIRYGLIDKSGNFISEPIYYTAGEFKEGLALVRVKTQTGELRYGYINKTGKFEIDPVYIYASEFSEGLAAVQFSKKVKSETDSGSVENIIAWAYIDKTGKTIIEESQISVPSKISMLGNFYNDVAAVSVFEFTETYYVNRKTLQPSYTGNNNKTQKAQASEEPSVVQKGPLIYEYVNAKGTKAFSKSFTRASDFQEGLAMVEIDKKVAFIDKKGDVKFSTDFRFTDNTKTGGFKNGFFTFITAEGKYGVINKQGKVVINAEYSFIGEFN